METIDDIVREMRTLGRLDEKSTDKIPRSLQALGLRTYADRIEAAVKHQFREVTKKEQPNKIEIGENNLIRLNMAKARDALRKVISLYKSWASSGEVANNYLMSACHVAMDALAEPPRNCDVYTETQLCEIVTKEAKSELPADIPQGIRDIVDIVAKGVIKSLFAEAKGEAE